MSDISHHHMVLSHSVKGPLDTNAIGASITVLYLRSLIGFYYCILNGEK